ncbi:MAG TPA: immunoglobulin domain-containing protein, partial [Clostridia bacterium]|nr:immunoglobulin domain-containing protein [Clostridia bacterium]
SKTVLGSNQNATKETGEPNHAGYTGGSSVWWTWTAPSNGAYRVSTRGSDFDTVLAVYKGSNVSALELVDDNDDGMGMETASEVSFSATAGTAYQIAVDGYEQAAGKIILSVYPTTLSQEIYYSGFESDEGFQTIYTLAGQGGWQSSGSGQNGVVFDYFDDLSQQAYLGVSSPVSGGSQFLWHPLSVTLNTNTRPVVIFSTYMEIQDSTNYRYDNFGWDVYNKNGDRLFFLDFDNSDLGIYYRLNDGSGYQDTGQTFQNGQIYYLEITMDFAANRWSATLDGSPLVTRQPISASANVALNLGDIDVAWIRSSGTFGDNYMLFDDYYVTAEPSQVPKIVTNPESQSVAVGGAATFLVAVDSSLDVSYQWQFNGANLPGATQVALSLNNLTPSQAGNYTVVVSNSAGVATSAPAVLTLRQLPNLAPYKPSAWSDRIVVSTIPGTNVDAAIILPTQDVYVSWAVADPTSNESIGSRFYTQLYVDGVLNQTWYSEGLGAGRYSFVSGYKLGKLAAGTHTLRIETDSTGVVPESDESDNSFTRTILVSSSTPTARLGQPSRTNGIFHLTLEGTASHTYEIQSSSNLVNWSVLATIVNTNSSGVFQFRDPTATNATQRFYRTREIAP